MTQTTLSVDDTSDVIDALRARLKIVGPRKRHFAVPPLTVGKRSRAGGAG